MAHHNRLRKELSCRHMRTRERVCMCVCKGPLNLTGKICGYKSYGSAYWFVL